MINLTAFILNSTNTLLLVENYPSGYDGQLLNIIGAI